MIGIKTGSSAHFNMFGQIKPKLGLVFYDFVNFLKSLDIDDIIITSIIRPKTNDSGIHALGRAIDVRASFPREIGKVAEAYINSKYKYDPKRPKYKTIICHKSKAAGDNGAHYHIQVMGD